MVVLVVVAVVAVVVFVFFFSWDPPAAVPSLRFVPESRSTNNMDGVPAFGDSVRRLVVTTPMVVLGGVFVGEVSMGTTSTSFPGCPWSR